MGGRRDMFAAASEIPLVSLDRVSIITRHRLELLGDSLRHRSFRPLNYAAARFRFGPPSGVRASMKHDVEQTGDLATAG